MLLCPKPDPEVHAALGASLAEACRLARVTLAGSETASLPGIVTELDLSGAALGYLKKVTQSLEKTFRQAIY